MVTVDRDPGEAKCKPPVDEVESADTRRVGADCKAESECKPPVDEVESADTRRVGADSDENPSSSQCSTGIRKKADDQCDFNSEFPGEANVSNSLKLGGVAMKTTIEGPSGSPKPSQDPGGGRGDGGQGGKRVPGDGLGVISKTGFGVRGAFCGGRGAFRECERTHGGDARGANHGQF